MARAPRDFQPRNEYGKVAEFRRVPIADIVKMLNTDTDIALEAGLVMLSFLERREYLSLLANGGWRGEN